MVYGYGGKAACLAPTIPKVSAMDELARISAVGPAATRRHAGLSRRAFRETIWFHIFTLPWLLGFLSLAVIPLVLGLATSFTNYDGLNLDQLKFTGLTNYGRAFITPDFYISLRNSARYAIVAVPIGLALSLLLAALLNQPIKGRDFLRLLYYVPAILPVAGAARAWSLLFGQNSGLVNSFLSVFRPGTAINWTNDQFFLMLYLYEWWHMGGGMVLFLAGLQGIPVELYEAGRLDGANSFHLFRRITLPLITPVVFFQLIMGLIWSLQIFDVPILIYGRAGMWGTVNMPQDKFMYMIYIYSQTFDFQRFGYGVALSWLFFILVLILTVVVIATSKYWVYYEVAQEGEAR